MGSCSPPRSAYFHLLLSLPRNSSAGSITSQICRSNVLPPFLILWTFFRSSVSLTCSNYDSPGFYHSQFPWHHPGSHLAPQNTSLIINLKMTRTRWTLFFPANTACTGHPSQAQDWVCPSEPLSQQHWHCCLIPCSQASSKYWNAFPYHQLDLPRARYALCCPIPITIPYPLFWLQTQNRLKGEDKVFLCPMMLCLASSFIWDATGRVSGSINQEAQRSSCPSSPAVHNPTRSALKLLFLRGFWAVLSFSQSISLPAAVEWNRTPNTALVWVHTLSGN